MSFSYVPKQTKGTIKVDGNQITAKGTFNKELISGGTVQIKLESTAGANNIVEIDITDIKLTAAVEAITTFDVAQKVLIL